MASSTLWLRELTGAALAADGGTDRVALLFVEYYPPADGQRRLRVGGIAAGAAEVEVTVRAGPATASARSALATGGFVADLTIAAPAPPPDVVQIEARNLGQGRSGSDSAVALLADLPAGAFHTIDPARLDYVAGVPDRLSYTRTFVKLDPLPPALMLGVELAVVDGDGKYYLLNQKRLEQSLSQRSGALREQVRKGAVSRAEYYGMLRQALAEAGAELTIPATKQQAEGLELRRTWDLMRRSQNSKKEERANAARALASQQAPLPLVLAAPVGGVLENLRRYLERRLAYTEAHQRLGVMFYERTRFRPLDLVLGEPIFQLALTPGEEVQLRQSAETRQRTALTEIGDQEAERSTRFSSVWSTDIGSAMGAQASFQQSVDLGAGVQGDLPKVPVGVSANVGTSTSDANSQSGEATASERRERTEEVAAKLRSQHKIQLELASEELSSFSSTRTLRNLNQQRSLLHTFYKVYRREQITLERYDAHLCLRLAVADPARDTRGAFLAGLARLDPAARAAAMLVAPRDAKTKSIPITVGRDLDLEPLHGFRTDRWLPLTIGNLAVAAGVGTGQVLAEPPVLTMTRCVIEVAEPLRYLGEDEGFDPDAVAEYDRVNVAPGVWASRHYVRAGGDVRWGAQPRAGDSNAVLQLLVNLPLTYESPISNAPEQWVSSVEFRIDTHWVASGAALDQHLRDLKAAENAFAAAIEPETIYELQRIAEADYPGRVLDRALAEQLRPPRDFDFGTLKDLFDLEQVVFDNVPYWADPVGRARHDELQTRLLRLPTQLDLRRVLTDSLTASQALVYLPIRRGKEAQALALLPEAAPFAEELGNEFTAFRQRTYAPITKFQPPAILAHMGPAWPRPTPAGAASWSQPWEQPASNFQILGQWSELAPTDGLHVETHLSATAATDEHERHRLMRLEATRG